MAGSIEWNMVSRAASGAVGNITGQMDAGRSPNIGSIVGSAVGGALSGAIAPGAYGVQLATATERIVAGIPGAGISVTGNIVGTNLGKKGPYDPPACP